MAYCAIDARPCREDDLQNVRTDCCRGRNAEDVNEHREGDKPAADSHDCSEHADNYSAHCDKEPGDFPPAQVLVKGDHRRDIDLLKAY